MKDAVLEAAAKSLYHIAMLNDEDFGMRSWEELNDNGRASICTTLFQLMEDKDFVAYIKRHLDNVHT